MTTRAVPKSRTVKAPKPQSREKIAPMSKGIPRAPYCKSKKEAQP